MSLDHYDPPSDATFASLTLEPIPLLKQGWALAKPHYWELCAILVLGAALSGAVANVPLAGGLLSGLINVTGAAGLLHYFTKCYRGENPDWDVLLEPIKQRPAAVVLAFAAQALLIGVGLVFLVLPGLYFAVTTVLTLPFVIYSDVPALEALGRSMRLIKGRWRTWFAFMGVVFAVNLLGLALAGVGLLVTIPATLGAFTLINARLFGIPHAPTGRVVGASVG